MISTENTGNEPHRSVIFFTRTMWLFLKTFYRLFSNSKFTSFPICRQCCGLETNLSYHELKSEHLFGQGQNIWIRHHLFASHWIKCVLSFLTSSLNVEGPAILQWLQIKSSLGWGVGSSSINNLFWGDTGKVSVTWETDGNLKIYPQIFI